MAKVGVVLSGCGVFDGSEIHEAVAMLLALDQQGADYQCMAPQKELEVVDHLTKQPAAEKRDVLTESARIARGEIVNLSDVNVSDYDAFVFPGGFGAAKNLCTFAADGVDCTVDSDVQRLLVEAQAAGKPIGLACIAPVIAAKVFGRTLSPQLTIGHDAATAQQIEAMGARHQPCDVDDVVVDTTSRIVTTPAYMEAERIGQVFTGIAKLVASVLQLVEQPASVQ